jgi:hypothetical protein
MKQGSTKAKRKPLAVVVESVVLHPKMNDCFVATAKDLKQIAVQVHDCRNGEVYYMVWHDGGGMVGSPNRCTLPLWQRQLEGTTVDSSKKAWKAFYDKQNAEGQGRREATYPELACSALDSDEPDEREERCDSCGETSRCLMRGLCPMCYELNGGTHD